MSRGILELLKKRKEDLHEKEASVVAGDAAADAEDEVQVIQVPIAAAVVPVAAAVAVAPVAAAVAALPGPPAVPAAALAPAAVVPILGGVVHDPVDALGKQDFVFEERVLNSKCYTSTRTRPWA